MDPKKLKAFAQGGGGGGHDEDMDEGGDEGQHAEEEEGEGDQKKDFGPLIPLLEKNAEDIEDASDEVDPDVLTNPEGEVSDQDKQTLSEQLDDLDEELVNQMKESLGGGISHDEAMELARHLEDEELIEDADRVGGWIFRMASVIQQGGGEGEEEEENEEEEEPEEEEETEGEEAGAE